MKYRVLILFPAFLITTVPDIYAHNLVSASGLTQGHQHVYRHQEYGKPLQQGHQFQSSGGSSRILWGSDMRPEYGSSTIRRNGRIIDGRKSRSGAKSKPRNKFGATVKGYGKPVQNYGKPVRGYGKPGLKQ